MTAAIVTDDRFPAHWNIYATSGVYRARRKGFPVALERVADTLEELVQSCRSFDEDVTQRSYGGRIAS